MPGADHDTDDNVEAVHAHSSLEGGSMFPPLGPDRIILSCIINHW